MRRAAASARRLVLALLYAGYLCAFALAVLYVGFWRPFVRELREPRPAAAAPEAPRHVDPATMRRVGSLHPQKRSSFVHFEREKGPGVVRLCAFGDSFTYGDEVGEALDYPSLLQDLLREEGAENVEVLNFGNSWHGFHQAHMMWSSLGRGFGCDVVLLGPACFQPDRDTTFNHTDLRQPYFLHARYVLEGDGVELVEVEGASHEARFDDYFRFFPRWRYLRYDSNAPPALLAVVPRGRRLPNPFYYRSPLARREEALATYRILLRQIAESGALVVLRHVEEDVVALARALEGPNLVAETV